MGFQLKATLKSTSKRLNKKKLLNATGVIDDFFLKLTFYIINLTYCCRTSSSNRKLGKNLLYVSFPQRKTFRILNKFFLLTIM